MKNGDKKHKELQAVVLGRQAGKSHYFINDTFVRDYLVFTKSCMTVEQWDNTNNISEADALAYPNARTAYELQQSPLGKALV